MDKKRKAKLVLTPQEKLLIRCFEKDIITVGGLTDNIMKMINKHGIKKLAVLAFENYNEKAI